MSLKTHKSDSSFSPKGYNVENIEEMEVDGKLLKILGSVALKAVLVPQANSVNSRFEIYQTWHDWTPDKIRPYMSDPRMQALRQFCHNIWPEDLKKNPEWIKRLPFEQVTKINIEKKDMAFLNRETETETTSNSNVKPAKAVTPQEDDPDISAKGKLAMQLIEEIKIARTTQEKIVLQNKLNVIEKELRDLGIPTTDEWNKDPKYWIAKATEINMTSKLSANVPNGLPFAKGYNVENIEEMEVDGKPITVLGSILLKAVLIPEKDSDNFKFEIFHEWHGWLYHEIKSYMIDLRMQAIKRFYRDILSEELKNNSDWIKKSPFEQTS